MIGMDNMSSAMAPLEHEAWFLQLFAHLSNPILGVLAGALLTTVMQSSSASVGVLQALSGTGAITFGNAVPMIMGAKYRLLYHRAAILHRSQQERPADGHGTSLF